MIVIYKRRGIKLIYYNRLSINVLIEFLINLYCEGRVIGQKELVKTAVVVENTTATAVISFLKEDTGWTKRVGKIA